MQADSVFISTEYRILIINGAFQNHAKRQVVTVLVTDHPAIQTFHLPLKAARVQATGDRRFPGIPILVKTHTSEIDPDRFQFKCMLERAS